MWIESCLLCILKLLPSQGDTKTCILVHLWTSSLLPSPLIIQKTEEPLSKATSSTKQGVRDGNSSGGGPGPGSGIVLLLCPEGFCLPAQKELLFKSKEDIDTVKENKTSKVNGTHTRRVFTWGFIKAETLQISIKEKNDKLRAPPVACPRRASTVLQGPKMPLSHL